MYGTQIDADLQMIARGRGVPVQRLRHGLEQANQAVLVQRERAKVRPLHPHGLKAVVAHLPHRHRVAA